VYPPGPSGSVTAAHTCVSFVADVRIEHEGIDQVPYIITERTDLPANAWGLHPYSVRFAGCKSNPNPFAGCTAFGTLTFNLNTVCFDPSRFRVKKFGIGTPTPDCPPPWMASIRDEFPPTASCVSASEAVGVHLVDPGFDAIVVTSGTALVETGPGNGDDANRFATAAPIQDVSKLLLIESSNFPENSWVTMWLNMNNTREACGGDRDGMIAGDALMLEWRAETEPKYLARRLQRVSQETGSILWDINTPAPDGYVSVVTGDIVLRGDTLGDWSKFYWECSHVAPSETRCDPLRENTPRLPSQGYLACSAESAVETLCSAWMGAGAPPDPSCNVDGDIVSLGLVASPTAAICGAFGDVIGFAADHVFGWIAEAVDTSSCGGDLADNDVAGGVGKYHTSDGVTVTGEIENDESGNARLFVNTLIILP
jgi:hypothetical protein